MTLKELGKSGKDGVKIPFELSFKKNPWNKGDQID